jgi:hypothetical protein
VLAWAGEDLMLLPHMDRARGKGLGLEGGGGISLMKENGEDAIEVELDDAATALKVV